MTSVRLAPRLAPVAASTPAPGPVASSGPRPIDGFERRSVSVLVLQRGMTGPAVRGLQQRLVSAGFMPLADLRSGPGVYGPRTEAAVRRLQARVGLPQTGVAAPSTLAALNSGVRYEAAPRRPAPEITQPVGRPAVHARLFETLTDEETQPMGRPV